MVQMISMTKRRLFLIIALLVSIFIFVLTSIIQRYSRDNIAVKGTVQEVKVGHDVEQIGGNKLVGYDKRMHVLEGMTEIDMINTLLEHDIEHQNLLEIIELIEKRPELLTCTVKDGKYLIHLAVEADYSELVEQLLSLSADVNAEDTNKQRALHLAACLPDSTEILTMLIKADAEIDAMDTNGETALAHAVICGNYDAAEILLENGANPNLYITPEGSIEAIHVKTILNIAISLNDSEMCFLLLQHLADPSLNDSLMFNALHSAAFYGRANIVKVLVESNVDINALCTQCALLNSPSGSQFKGLTAFDLAVEKGFEKVYNFLWRCGGRNSDLKKLKSFKPKLHEKILYTIRHLP